MGAWKTLSLGALAAVAIVVAIYTTFAPQVDEIPSLGAVSQLRGLTIASFPTSGMLVKGEQPYPWHLSIGGMIDKQDVDDWLNEQIADDRFRTFGTYPSEADEKWPDSIASGVATYGWPEKVRRIGDDLMFIDTFEAGLRYQLFVDRTQDCFYLEIDDTRRRGR